jgi:hypothetical protein
MKHDDSELVWRIAIGLCANPESGKHVGAGATWDNDLKASTCWHCAEIVEQLRKRGPVTFDKRCADALADEVDVLVRRRILDARSAAADALLDYRNPPSTPRTDRLVTLEERVLRMAEPWPLTDILTRLVDGVEHLLSEHACDVHGHELLRRAQKEARKVVQAIEGIGAKS